MVLPNILLIFTDQQRFDTIHALGNDKIFTPNFDKLAERGVSFTNAYTNSPVCVAARQVMHTGLLPHHTGCFDNGDATGRTSFMQVLSARGYQTHGVGKMHFTHSDRLWGFDSRDESEECGAVDDYKKFIDESGFSHVVEPLGFRSEMYYIPQVSQVSLETHNSYWVADRSIEYLKSTDRNKPFFLMSSFIKPHPPFETPVPWNKLYRMVDMDLAKCPEGNDDVTTYWNKFQNRYKYRDKGTDVNLYRTMKAAYYAAISFVDYNVGRILAYMDSQNLLDNTIILLTADHGEMLGDYDCYGKRSFLNSAAKIPMILNAPDISGGMICDELVSLVDVFATFTGNKDTDGASLIDVANGKVERDHVVGQYSEGNSALYMYATKDYKYIYSAADDKEFLFDADETINYAGISPYTEIYRKKLIDEYKRSAVPKALEGIDGDEFKKYPALKVPDDPDAMLLRQDTQSSIPNKKDFVRF